MTQRPVVRIAVALLFATACAPASKPEAKVQTQQQAVLSPILSQGFESGLGTWVAATTSGSGTWHVLTNPQTLSVASALNPFVVTLADTGAHLSAAGGTGAAWFGDDATGTFIGLGYPAQTAKNGGTSAAVQTGTLTSPSFSLTGSAKAQLEFDSWWEIEGTAAASYDLCQVWASNNGAAFVMLGQLNPTFAIQQPAYAAYSSGGPAAAPVWRHYSYDLSAYAGSANVRVQFRFDSRDKSYNAFRGFTVDNVLISGGPALNAPSLVSVSPAVATLNDLVTITGSNFIQGAIFTVGTTQIAANAITQFGANEMIFKVPSMAAGTYSVKVTNPDGQTFTLASAFTFSGTPSPTVSAVSPATATTGVAKSVTISGTNFVSGATVSFGETAASSVVVGSATSLTATAPALSSGTWNVTVTNPTGQGGTKFAAYTVSDTSTISLTSPNGGQSWTAGTVQDLTWSSAGLSAISADLYKGGVFVANIAVSVPAATGSFAWTLPGGLAAGTDYKVKLFNPLGTVSTLSAANFTITAGAIATTTTASSSVNSSAAGQAVSFTAAISPAVTGGTVQFSIDGAAFGGPVAVSGSQATSDAITTLTGGAHTILATYSGAAPFTGSSGSLTQNVNRSPVAEAQAISTQENVSQPFVLAATDPDADALTYAVVSGPAHGTLSGTAPSLTYVPAPGYFGADEVTFKANDGRADSNVATVSVTVAEVNVAPSASSQAIATNEESAVLVTLVGTDGDGDALTYTIVSGPTHGTLSGNAPNLSYLPAVNFAGADAFTFRVNDGALDSNIATVSISVAALNDAPVAAAQALSTSEESARVITLAASDVEADPLTYQVVAGPAHGTLSGTGANLTYQPAPDFHGADAFTFKANDGAADSNVATISLTVTPVNDAPIAVAQAISTSEEAAATVTLGGTDVDGDSLTFTIVTAPAHGTLTGTAPNLSYQPAADYAGPDAFTFKVNDGAADSNVATISISVDGMNDAPVANAQVLSSAEDTAGAITLTASDVEGDSLTYQVVTGPAHGTLTGSGPNLTYQPAADFHGADAFTFKANDGAADSNVATISLTVTPVNDAPIAVAQAITTAEETAAAVILGGTDVDGDSLSFTLVTAPAHGTLSGTAPNLSYQPVGDYHGPDAFTFRANDGALDSAIATISLSVTAVNDAPTAAGQSLGTQEDTAVALTLTGSDVEADPLTFSVVSAPAHGTLSGTAPNFTYQPAADYHGPDAFSFRVNDGSADSSPALVELTVSAVNDAPVAQAQTRTTAEDTAVTVIVAASDVDGDALTWTIVTQPSHGTLQGSGPDFSYQPAADYHGPDAFSFKASDGALDSNVETVSLTVSSVNDAPVAVAQSPNTQEDVGAAITLSATDLDGDPLTYSIVTPPAHGTLTGSAPDFTWQPAANYHGPDSFTFKANDGSADSSPVTVTLTVSPVNDAPVAQAQSLTTAEDTALALTLSGSDVDGDPLGYTIVIAPAHGTLSGTAPNLSWSPSPGYHGPDSFSFRVDDGALDSEVAVITLTVDSVNDAPVATAQALQTAEDTAIAVVLGGTDADADPLSYQVVTPPQHGVLTGDAPQLTYVPAADYHGPDAFSFIVQDGDASSSPAIVELVVTAVNDAPAGISAAITLDEDGTAAVTFAGTDVDGDPLSFRAAMPPAHGTLTGAAPNLTYAPASNYNGPDSITFLANDGSLDSAPVTISITVEAVNDVPVATALLVDAEEDEGTSITLQGTDVELDALTFTLDSPPQHGTLTGVAPDLVYTPQANYAGPDAFSFHVSDAVSDSALAQVSIEVGPINDAPLATAQALTLGEDTELPLTLTGTDEEGSPLTFTIVRAPAHGQLTGSGAELRYQPAADFHGADEFTFVANDGQVDSAPATVGLTIDPINDAPVASSQAQGTQEDTAVELTLAGTDVDGDALTYTVTSSPAHGVLSGTGSAVLYTPSPEFHGADAFSFKVNDGTVDSPDAVVTIDVGWRNDAPVAQAAAFTTSEDTALELSLVASDLDGDPLTFVVVTQPAHGTLSGTPPQLTYLAEANYFGPDSFTFKANDGAADSNLATVALTVSPVDDVPVAQALSISLSQSTATQVELRGSDVEAAVLTFTILTWPQHGTLTGEVPTLVYKPDPAYSGADAFTYRVSADGVDSELAEVAIEVLPADDSLAGGGLGCSSTGSSMPWVLLGLLVLFQVMRRRRVAGALGLVVSVAAQAQTTLPSVDVESLRLNPAASQSLVTETGAMMTPQTIRFAVTGHYEYEPLVLFRDGERLGGLVKDRFTTHFGAAWAPLPWLEVAAQLPVVLMQRSDDLSAYGYARPASAALGTTLLQGRFGLLQQRSGAPIDLALSLGLELPLATDAALARESGFGALPRLGVGRALLPWLRVGGEAGVMLRPAASFRGEVVGRTALLSALMVETVGNSLRGELSWRAAIPLAGGAVGSELLAGGRYAMTPYLEVYALAGVGLGRGLGTPAFRVAAGLAFALPLARSIPQPQEVAPPPAPIAVAAPVEPEPVAAPAEPVAVEAVVVEPEPVEAEPVEAEPVEAEPVEAEPVEAEPVAPSAPDPAALTEEIALELSKVRMFVRMSAELNPAALPALERVAQLLKAHPEFVDLQIEGHADSSGSAELNDRLSLARAHTVRGWLVSQGLEEGSIEAISLGARRPLASNDTEQGRELNRRVEIIVR